MQSHRTAHESDPVPSVPGDLLNDSLRSPTELAEFRETLLSQISLRRSPCCALRHLRAYSVLRILQLPHDSAEEDSPVIPVPANRELTDEQFMSAKVGFW